MSYQLIKEASLEGKTIQYVESPFDEAHGVITSRNGRIISGRHLAFARIQTGPNHSLSQNGSYIQEGILYDAKATFPLFLSVSSILEHAIESTQANRDGKEYFPHEKTIETYRNQSEEDIKENPQERRALIIHQTESFEIPTNRFNQEELTLWLFKVQAEEYGDYLREDGIKEMPVYLVGKEFTKNQKKPFERQLWLDHLGVRSNLSGNYRDLDYYDRVRGVFKESDGGSRNKLK